MSVAAVVRAASTVGLTDLETTILKATYEDEKGPKPKHVATLIDLSHTRPHYDFVPLLDRRLSTGKWKIVEKTLTVIHKLAIDGHENFLKYLTGNLHMFNMGSFLDTQSVDGTDHSRFIRYYADYLLEKVSLFKNMNYSGERSQPSESKTWVLSLSIEKLCTYLPLIQEQFDKLLLCQPLVIGRHLHPVDAASMALLIKDGFRIHSMLTVQMLHILDNFQNMDLAQTTVALQGARNFLKENDKFRDWAKELCRLKLFDKELLPNFDTIPPTFITLLEEHLTAVQGEATEAKATGKKPAKKKATPKATPTAATSTGKGGAASPAAAPTSERKVAAVAAPPPDVHHRHAQPAQPVATPVAATTPSFAVGGWDEPAVTPVVTRPQPEFNIFDPFSAPAPAKPIAQDAFFTPVTSPPRATGAPVPAAANNTVSPRPVDGDPFAALTGIGGPAKRAEPVFRDPPPSAVTLSGNVFDPAFAAPAPQHQQPVYGNGGYGQPPYGAPVGRPAGAYDPFAPVPAAARGPAPGAYDPFAPVPAKQPAAYDPFAPVPAAAPTNGAYDPFAPVPAARPGAATGARVGAVPISGGYDPFAGLGGAR